MRILTLELDWFVKRLHSGPPFAFVRYGDGEFECITGKMGENCDHTRYTSDLAMALAQTLERPHGGEYYYALGPKVTRSPALGDTAARWIRERARVKTWYDTETFLRASLRGELYPFVQQLSERRVILIGGAHLERLPVIQPVAHVIVPDVGAWGEKRRIAQDVLNAAHVIVPDVVLFSAGMTTKVLMWELFPVLEGITLIDTGSLFDVYCGKDSRRYARKMDTAKKEELLRANFDSPFIKDDATWMETAMKAM